MAERRRGALCPHCGGETYLLEAKENPGAYQYIGKGVRYHPEDGSTRWNCPKCGAEHRHTHEVTLTKGGGTSTRSRLSTLPPPIPVLPLSKRIAPK